MSRTLLTTIMALVILVIVPGCGDDDSCEAPELLTRDDRVCSYEASCNGVTVRLTSSWLPLNGAESEVTYECWDATKTLNKKTTKVGKNPPPFCEAAGFKETCGFDVTFPGK
jgi:uncharacterized lipoprotein YehR (DUF1307 family)